MKEEIKETDAYKIFRQLEERNKRANPYTFYDKDELIDEILKQEDEIEDLQQKVEQLENIRKEAIEFIKENNCIAVNKEYLPKDYEWCCSYDLLNILNKGSEE